VLGNICHESAMLCRRCRVSDLAADLGRISVVKRTQLVCKYYSLANPFVSFVLFPVRQFLIRNVPHLAEVGLIHTISYCRVQIVKERRENWSLVWDGCMTPKQTGRLAATFQYWKMSGSRKSCKELEKEFLWEENFCVNRRVFMENVAQ
jgi:hypothetical protein